MTGSWWPVVAILAVVVATVALGTFGVRVARTTSDFLVASRAVTPFVNASAIGGEYLSAASFLGIAGLVLTYGVDMLWFPVGYTVGYLVLLVLVAAPLRRSGAYTLTDFTEMRFSPRMRRLSSLLVVLIGWLYLLPQLQGAGLTMAALTGAPSWVGSAIVAVVVALMVATGGMRSITVVQAFQYWLKLVAIALPAILLVAAWRGSGSPAFADGPWGTPLSGYGGREYPLYSTYSIVLATFLGTMGLPHVLVRFYTNPDGRTARRTTVAVLGLLSVFYLFPPIFGALGRVYAPDLAGNPEAADTVVLLLPGRVFSGWVGEALSSLVAAGAFAAFLSTASGLSVSVAGVLSQDVFGRGTRWGDAVRRFRLSTVVAVLVPFLLALVAGRADLAQTVTLAFAVAASTFAPVLVLGIWWPRLTMAGAFAALAAGGGSALVAVALVLALGRLHGFAGVLLDQPAAWTVPLAFLSAVVVSLVTRDRSPRTTAAAMLQLHSPEQLGTR